MAREYYFNDAGNQIRLLGASVQARARGEEVPEGGYQGDYVRELAAADPRRRQRPTSTWLARAAVELLLAQIKATLERYGVRFDRFFSERTLHEGEPSAVERALAALEDARPHLPLRGRHLAAHDDLRRRQGPRRHPLATASRPTWPPTSPTCRTSASGALSASSSRWAPTTTAGRAR